ncbi:hypothetical protein IM792_15640 [Mucilaginibacter sp. JRF]|uniref:hypothetical protein n=1 Tax=Mucilaginibacter sp. JRF TaxID=2780088 RepID=UPI00188188BD|nr:hypothetical protein [Mucilaginibacter sp. JRF]MBE9585889.1 hypothetical protein [Mucilaginibacter sp. JRF]
MKKNLVTPIAILYLAMALLGCQRKNDVIPAGAAKTGTDATAAAVTINPYTILNITTAGIPNGFTAGSIYLKNSGSLYVTDVTNNSIKKIDITPVSTANQFTSVITTVNTPPGENGLRLTNPINVVGTNNGSINVLFRTDDRFGSVVYGRIYGPSGSIYTLPVSRIGNIGMSGDPSGSFAWFCSFDGIGKFFSSHIQLPNFKIPADSLYELQNGEQKRGSPVTRIFVGASGTKYLVNNQQIFKLTSGGQLIRAKPYANYPYTPYESMTGLVATGDNKIIYFTKNGRIMKLENSVITTLVYPSGQTSTEGTAAFIRAGELAIDEQQHLLYFADSYSSSGGNIKALTLPGYQGH